MIDPVASSATSAWQRFEHPAPNDLWQMDFKGPLVTRAAPCHALTILDDHSRFNVCLQTLPSQKGGPVQATLVKIFRQYRLPNRLLTDNGSPWGHTGEHLAAVAASGVALFVVSQPTLGLDSLCRWGPPKGVAWGFGSGPENTLVPVFEPFKIPY